MGEGKRLEEMRAFEEAIKRAFLAGHIAGSSCAGWCGWTAPDEERLQAAEKDWDLLEDGPALIPPADPSARHVEHIEDLLREKGEYRG